MIAKQDNKSAVKIFAVLDVLFLNFGVGFTQTEIREATGLSATLVHRYVRRCWKSAMPRKSTVPSAIGPVIESPRSLGRSYSH